MTDALHQSVAVTQADRRAYLEWSMLPLTDVHAVLAGEWDGTTGMQVLARHRIAALEEAAKVAEDRHVHWNSTDGHSVECDVSACRDIAAAIRNLALSRIEARGSA